MVRRGRGSRLDRFHRRAPRSIQGGGTQEYRHSYLSRGDCDSTHSGDVDYAKLLPSMFKMSAGYLLIQLASESAKERVCNLIGEHIRADANGVAQLCFIGVINPLNPRVKSPQEVCNDLMLASKYIPKERLGSIEDCGLSPFSIDVKPKHGSPDIARGIAFEKLSRASRLRKWHPRDSGVHDPRPSVIRVTIANHGSAIGTPR